LFHWPLKSIFVIQNYKKMGLKTTVKVSGVNNLSNARYCAGMGVDMLGFDMDTMPAEQFKEIRNWVAGVNIVGETKSDNIAEVLAKIEQFKPDLIEINDLDLAIELFQKSDIEIILNEQSVKSSLKYPENIKFLHFNSISKEDLHAYFSFPYEPSLLISNKNLKENNIEIQDSKFGITIDADIEERPGFSNFENTMEILESLESDY
jgi:phosphoribosylanthranilate isomerase